MQKICSFRYTSKQYSFFGQKYFAHQQLGHGVMRQIYALCVCRSRVSPGSIVPYLTDDHDSLHCWPGTARVHRHNEMQFHHLHLRSTPPAPTPTGYSSNCSVCRHCKHAILVCGVHKALLHLKINQFFKYNALHRVHSPPSIILDQLIPLFICTFPWKLSIIDNNGFSFQVSKQVPHIYHAKVSSRQDCVYLIFHRISISFNNRLIN